MQTDNSVKTGAPPLKPVYDDIEVYDETVDAEVLEYPPIRKGGFAVQLFRDGETVVVTEKVGGTHVKIGMVGDRIIAASTSHRRKRPTRADGTMALLGGEEMRRNIHWFPWTLHGVQELVRELHERFRVVLLNGEVFACGLPKGHGFAFLAFDLKLDAKYIGWDRLTEICAKHRVPMVPELYRGPFDASVIRALADGDSVVSAKTQICEGVVVRPPTEEWRGEPPERAIFKYIGERYLALYRPGDDMTDI